MIKLEYVILYATLSLVVIGFVLAFLNLDGGRAIAGLGIFMHLIIYIIMYFGDKPRDVKKLPALAMLTGVIVIGKFSAKLGFGGSIALMIVFSAYLAYHAFHPSYLYQLEEKVSKRLGGFSAIFFALFVGGAIMKVLHLAGADISFLIGGLGLAIMLFFIGAYKSFGK